MERTLVPLPAVVLVLLSVVRVLLLYWDTAPVLTLSVGLVRLALQRAQKGGRKVIPASAKQQTVQVPASPYPPMRRAVLM